MTRYEQFLALRREGLSNADIARRCNVSRQWVRLVLDERGKPSAIGRRVSASILGRRRRAAGELPAGAKPVELRRDPEPGDRNERCEHMGDCLRLVAKRNWRGWACVVCPHAAVQRPGGKGLRCRSAMT